MAESFTELFVTAYPTILRYARRRLPSTVTAEDVAAETLAAAWRDWSRGLRHDLRWLHGVAAHKIADHYRDEERRGDLVAALARAGTDPAEPDGWLVRALADAVAQLSGRDREVIVMTYWRGMTGEEIARVMGISTSAVWAVQSRARRRLRALLEEAGRQ